MSEGFPERNSFFSLPDWQDWADRLIMPERECPKAIIACSGGADSVFLACLLVFHYGKKFLQNLRVVHVNHGLRGTEADADADFVCALAEWLGLSFVLVKLPDPPEGVMPAEGALRDQRFIALERGLRDWGGSAMYLGHHKNDIAEGMLISLSRGSSLSGLASPRPKQVFACSKAQSKDETYHRCHPLLGFSRMEIEASLGRAGMSWQEDASNTDAKHLRNRLRHRVVEEWVQASSQDILESVAISRTYLEQADSALEWWLGSLGLDTANPDYLSGHSLRGLPMELWRRSFWRWVNQCHGGLEIRRKALDPFLQHWQHGQSFEWSVGPELSFHCRDNEIHRVRHSAQEQHPEYSVNWSLDSQLFLPNGKQLSAQWIETTEALKRIDQRQTDNHKEALISVNKGKSLQVSSWQSGDRMKPLGAPGERKLQDIFVDKKIPLHQRHHLPILRHPETQDILWVPGLPPAECVRVVKGSVRVLCVGYG